MSFGTSNLQYGDDLGGTASDFGTTIYDEYLGDSIVSDEVNVGDYLWDYDPLKEQNLLADYMDGLVDFGDKKEDVRTKAIAERKALSKSIKGGLSSGSMQAADEAGRDSASKATASLYRSQAKAHRDLGDSIGGLRAAYEGDIAESVELYNAEIETGLTVDETAAATASGDLGLQQYIEKHGLQDGTTEAHGYGADDASTGNFWGTNGDTWFDTRNNTTYVYYDEGLLDNGKWIKGTYEDRYK